MNKKLVTLAVAAAMAAPGAALAAATIYGKLHVSLGEPKTEASYRLFVVPDDDHAPDRPGMLRANYGGEAIALVRWTMPESSIGNFVASIPSPLGIGKVVLEDGRVAPGFLCESSATAVCQEITTFGDWRSWLAGLVVPGSKSD